ncbi:MAG: VOC family protein [Bacillota bacterium]|jgi:predicted enzyme related to lactoylglutathione lyase
MTEAAGRIIRHDLMSTDPASAAAFHAALFGWRVTELQVMGFTVRRLSLGDRVLGAIMPFDPKLGLPSHWVPYLQVESVDDTCRRVTELGGEVCMGAMDIPPGRFALTNDPSGALFSPFTPKEPAPATPTPVPPGMFCWDELLTTDPDAAAAFYAALLDWEPVSESMPGGGIYTVMRRAGRPVAGVMARPARATFRSHWLPYVATANVDDTAERARGLGATITTPPSDIPGIGRFAVLIDPAAARLALLSATA